MSNFYTHVSVYGRKILYRGYTNGHRTLMRDEFIPTLYVTSKNKSDWKSLYGADLSPMTFGDIKEAKNFAEEYENVFGFEVHGMTDYQYQYINNNFRGEIDYDVDQINIMFLDIEVVDPNGSTEFPDIQSASTPIVLISCRDKATGKTVIFGWKKVTKPFSEFEYRCYRDELTMLKEFILFWQQNCPDIVSGWNSDQFDFPYLINRIMRILDEDHAKRLSPFGLIRERMLEIRGKEIQTYEIVGVSQIDYMNTYKKFGTYSTKESYALGNIAQEELGVTKHEIEGSTSFFDGYSRFYDDFVYYNHIDTELLHRLDDKLKLFDLILSLSYLVKCNFKDVFGPVKMWDVFIYNHLDKKKVAVPPRQKKLTGEFQGAWVKDVIPDMYGWNMSFDFASLYPTIIRQWNISPETLVKDEMLPITVDTILNEESDINGINWVQYAKDNDYSIAANGSMYRRDKRGMLPELMEFLMVGRKTAKKKMLLLEQEYQNTKDSSLPSKIAALNALQLALKVAANAGYGAVTNAGFRYFELKIGEAITLTGQASDRHAEKSINRYLNNILKTDNIDYGIAGDTDSLYLNVDPLVNRVAKDPSNIDSVVKLLDKIGNEIQKHPIQKSIDFIYDSCNCVDKLMDMKREAISSKAIFTAKKRYAMIVHNSEGVSYDPPKMKITGLDIIKSSTPRLIRDDLRGTLPVIFEHGVGPLRDYVTKTKKKFMTTEVENISFPRGISDLDKWFDGKTYKKGTPIHVRGAILYNQYVKKFGKYDTIRNGDRIKFVYLKLPNPIHEDVISFPTNGQLPVELNLHRYIDWDKMWQKTFISPLENITNAIKWELEERSSLDDFFG